MGNYVEIRLRKKNAAKGRSFDEAKVVDNFEASPWIIVDSLPENTPAMLALYCMQQDPDCCDILRACQDNQHHLTTPLGDIDGHLIKQALEEAKLRQEAYQNAHVLESQTPQVPSVRSTPRI